VPGVITIQSRLRYARWRTELSRYFAYEGIQCNGCGADQAEQQGRLAATGSACLLHCLHD